MKILQLGKFYPIRGGVEKVMWDLTRGLSGLADSSCCFSGLADSSRGLSGRGVSSDGIPGRGDVLCDMLCACLTPELPAVTTPALAHPDELGDLASAAAQPPAAAPTGSVVQEAEYAVTEGDCGSRVIHFNGAGRCICVPAKAKKAATMLSPAMVSWMRRHASEYDLIHVHQPDPMACLALLLSGYKGRVFVHWHSDILKQKFLLKLYVPLQTWLLKRAERIIGTTPVYVEQSPWLQKYQHKICCLPIGIEDTTRFAQTEDTTRFAQTEDATRFAPAACPTPAAGTETASSVPAPAETPAAGTETVSSVPGPAETPVAGTETASSVPGPAETPAAGSTSVSTVPHFIFSLGRLVEYKGYRYLIEAAKFLPDDYCIEIGGSGPLKAELQALIDAENLGRKVRLLGFVSDEDVRLKFNTCDLFVLPSVLKTEAFGIVQIEAMSCAKPVIATTIPGSGTSWVNAHGESGLNVPPCDPKALADAILAITSDRGIRNGFAERARQRFESLFTLDAMVEGYMKMLMAEK